MKKNIAITVASIAITAGLIVAVWYVPNKLAAKDFSKL